MAGNFINIDETNQKLLENDMKVMYDAESTYRGQLFLLVQDILKQKHLPQIVLLAGPSCAGKTTTARLIKEILETKKKKAIIVSMDDFFLNRDDTPLLPNGMKDFDSLRAINLKQMEECFRNLFAKGKAGFPRFDFISGLNLADDHQLEFDKDTIIIFEGLHVLNPELKKHLGTDRVYSVYADALKGFKRDNFYKISNRNLRLIRRMIRDYARRGNSPAKTLQTWKNVCDAEDTYITPYKDTANFLINTTHDFELALYKKEFFEIVMEHREVIQELPFLEIFEDSSSLDKRKIPATSLMWEFVDPPAVEEEKESKKEEENKQLEAAPKKRTCKKSK